MLVEGRIHVQNGYVSIFLNLFNLLFNFLRWDGVKAGPKTANTNQNQSIDIVQNVQSRRSGCCSS